MRKSWTLIELIFVIVVIGVLTSFALPKFNDTREYATANSIKQDIGAISRAINSYYLIKGDINDISDATSFNDSLWQKDSTGLKLDYVISGTSCASIEVDKSNPVSLVVSVDGSSHKVCKKLAQLGVVSSTQELY
jgi:general secretion pathway protein G